MELGQCQSPRVTQSAADFSVCKWSEDNKELCLEVGDPAWCKKLPDWFKYTAVIEHAGWEIITIEGGQVIRGSADRSIVKFENKNAALTFKNAK